MSGDQPLVPRPLDPRDLNSPPTPDEIPPHTIVEIAFDVDAVGNQIAVVEGVDVIPLPGEDARDAAIRAVAAMVDRAAGIDAFGRPYRYLRAKVVGDVERRSVVIHRDGRLFVSFDDPAPDSVPSTLAHSRPQPETPLDGELGKAAEVLLNRPTSANADPLPAATEPANASAAATATVQPRAPAGPRALLRGSAPSSRRERTARRAAARGSKLPVRSGDSLEAPPEPAPPTPRSRRVEASGPTVEDRAARRQRLMDEARRRTTQEQQGGTSTPRRMGRSLALIVTAAVTVVLAITLVAHQLGSGSGPGSLAAALPVSPPPGWAREATWSTGPLTADAGPVVGLNDAVAYVTTDREVVVADIATGEPRWRVTLPTGPVRGHLSRTQLAQTDALALHVGDRLLAWSVDAGKPVAAADLPTNAQVTYLGVAPLIGVGPETVAVIDSDGLTEIAVPEGAYALAARADRTVTAASAAGWWHLRAGRPAGKARPWENPGADARPADSHPSVTGYSGESIILTYPAFRNKPPEVVVHTDRASDVRASFRGPALAAGTEVGWVASPAGTWGVLGRTLVDIRAGAVADLGAWTTQSVTADRAFGLVGEQAVETGPTVQRGVLPDDTHPPETTTPDGAVIRLRGPIVDDTGEVVLPDGSEAGFIVLPEA